MSQGWTAPISLPAAPPPLFRVHYPQCKSTENQRGGDECKCADAELMLKPTSTAPPPPPPKATTTTTITVEDDEPLVFSEAKQQKKKKVVIIDEEEEDTLENFKELLDWIDWFQEENNLVVPANVHRNAKKLQRILAELDKIIATGNSHSSFIELYFMKRQAIVSEQSKTRRYNLLTNLINSYTPS